MKIPDVTKFPDAAYEESPTGAPPYPKGRVLSKNTTRRFSLNEGCFGC